MTILRTLASSEIYVDYSFGRPTEGNFLGNWQVALGFSSGKMELIERNFVLSGLYELDSGEKGAISGFRDGKTYKVDFIRKSGKAKWRIDALFERNNGFIEIKGKATLLIIENDNWTPTGEAKDFYSTSNITF